MHVMSTTDRIYWVRLRSLLGLHSRAAENIPEQNAVKMSPAKRSRDTERARPTIAMAATATATIVTGCKR
ncbi:hypothetical protein DOTSEDRAFT_43374 [Dothistroma septosporum NZE10]|uniref:Uncharacterized protein n=1 Tax=Dothistroma septosporum (strain NZE10 / CBS 128990) TaxID=675120 RepID=N1PPR3_DOTSN|nr:hypothetical protein DOTSEDRAFT_43374 [Dothistroma septosporum NZE10]